MTPSIVIGVILFRTAAALFDVFHDIPTRPARAKTAKQNCSVGVNDVSVGSPSRMRIVLLISFGMTTRPRSSILLTIPVAFIYIKSPCFCRFVMLVSAKARDLYRASLVLQEQKGKTTHARSSNACSASFGIP